jgi:predicted transcriptional regulator of viral defense system
MTHNKFIIKGIGKKSRIMLTEVLKKAPGFIDTQLVQSTLDVSQPLARVYLSRWAESGWIKRIKRGIYVPIDFTIQDPSLPLEDPWVMAQALFSPCYIAGWTAAHHWGFTDQLFNDICVLSSRKLSHTLNEVGFQKFIVKKTFQKKIFGLKTIWHENKKVFISDPHKTIVDILSDPSIGGGIRSVLDFLEEYLRSAHKNMEILLDYAEQMENKTIFKRLGFLLSYIGFEDQKILSFCLENISKGYSHLDPSSKGHTLVKRWNLWIPEYFRKSEKSS